MADIESLPLDIPPGVWTDITEAAAGKRWVAADKMRFRHGLPQTWGGWSKYFATAFNGVPRTMKTWTQLDGTLNTAAGTHKKVELLQGGVKYDITPLRAVRTGTLGANPIATNSTATVTITHAGHGLAVGNVVWFSGAAVVDGVDLNTMSWEVASVPTANTYTITYLVAATGTTAAGGGAAVAFNYDTVAMSADPINTAAGSTSVTVTWASHGLAVGESVTLSGLSTFNGVNPNGTWEIATVSPPNNFTFTYTAPASGGGAGGGALGRAQADIAPGSATGTSMRIWALAKYGEDLLICPTPDGRIYVWDASLGASKRARLVPKAPTADWIVVGEEQQFVNAYGTNSDNLAQVWSSLADLTQWTSTSTNTAGSKQYVAGSRIVGAISAQREIIVVTDTTAYSQQLVGGSDIYSFTSLGSADLIGPLAMAEQGGRVWIMGRRQFYTYAGGAMETMPCTIPRAVFKDLNMTEARGCVAGTIAAFDEVMFWYTRTSTGASYNDAWAKYNHAPDGQCWDPGTVGRTAWQDGGIITSPLGMDEDGYLYEHETGVSADGEPLDSYIISGDLDKMNGAGRQVMQRIAKLTFDAVMEGNYDLYIRHRKYPNRDYTVKGPWRITEDVDKVRPRVRNKYIAFEFQTPRNAYLPILTEAGEILVQEVINGAITTETELTDRTEDLLTFWRLGLPILDRQDAGYK